MCISHKTIKKAFVLLLLLLIPLLGQTSDYGGGNSLETATEQSVTKRAACTPFYTAGGGKCVFSQGEYKYVIHESGKGIRSRYGFEDQSFQLPLRSGERIESINYATYRGDLVVVCEVTDGEYGAGTIVRLDGETLKVLWVLQVPTFNLSEGLIEGSYLYQDAYRFESKVDLNSGRYIWVHKPKEGWIRENEVSIDQRTK